MNDRKDSKERIQKLLEVSVQCEISRPVSKEYKIQTRISNLPMFTTESKLV